MIPDSAAPLLNDWQTLAMVLCLAAGIMATRFVPFLLFSRKQRPPEAITYLGAALPSAAMALLLVYCVKHIVPSEYPHGLPELIAIVFTAGVEVWRNNILLSIAGGTALYMFLVQQVFV
ncbi:MAG: AzlD domain-containing protein [Planctomycetes bacterium]|nr:AzlD domain-containing protein [Planctomycetota bacterium]